MLNTVSIREFSQINLQRAFFEHSSHHDKNAQVGHVYEISVLVK